MNFSASIPVAQMAAANDLLNNTAQTPGKKSFGPHNFSVPAYAGPSPTNALLHAWSDAEFEAAVASIPGVVIQQGMADPILTTSTVAETVGAAWGNDAQPLTGTVTPGLYRDSENVLWWVIQSYNTATYPNPEIIPALITRARTPGVAAPWIQPINAYTAYKLLDPFTGQPETCMHNGFTWKVTQADGAGNNIWEPGVFGWSKV